MSDDVARVLVLIAGPIAAGKSTLARAVADRLRDQGRSVALVDLDTVAEMALPTLPDWAWAHEIHARLVGHWTRVPLEVVVDEGASTRAEVDQVLAGVPGPTAVITVVLVADVRRSWERAQGDPTRGISKDRGFLERVYAQFERELPALDHDVLLDAESTSPEQRLAPILAEVERHLAR
ncbi:adenylyl-sulfate kinase [Occultella glacieicola]|uniref:Adenylyl-sulfate kinase n=1 Tax=Occultella glacieicola TaxID=2518684 RepID=A0ABY2EB93_9MICO|nr:AAA family ATPase [Occultella glacieicola]TDE99043.1 adenylyl-sulfate kinase [Occultella glacieicola]